MKRGICICCNHTIYSQGYQVSKIRKTRTNNVFTRVYHWKKLKTVFLCKNCYDGFGFGELCEI